MENKEAKKLNEKTTTILAVMLLPLWIFAGILLHVSNVPYEVGGVVLVVLTGIILCVILALKER